MLARISAWWYVGVVLLAVAAGYAIQQALLVREVVVTTDSALTRMDRRIGEIPLLTEEEVEQLRRSLNETHLREARVRGLQPVLRRNRLVRLAREAGLVRLESTPRYRILDATHSVPIATHGVRRALDSISVHFWGDLEARGLPGFRFTVSSLLRSAEDQAALTEVNMNAAREQSSHEYGTTFDITYRQFSFRGGPEPDMTRLPSGIAPILRGQLRGRLQARRNSAYREMAQTHAPELAAALGRAIIALEDEGVLLGLRENRQPVYHVTALLDSTDSDTTPTGGAR